MRGEECPIESSRVDNGLVFWGEMGVNPKIGGFYPPKRMVYFMENWKTLLKWMIWGAHPYFWKHPDGL